MLTTPDVIGWVQSFHFNNSYVLTADRAVLSNVISNVPAVLALKPFVLGLSDRNRIWLVMPMRATLAGNLTPAGSVANLDCHRTRPQRRHSCFSVDLLPRRNSDNARHACAGYGKVFRTIRMAAKLA